MIFRNLASMLFSLAPVILFRAESPNLFNPVASPRELKCNSLTSTLKGQLNLV